MTSNTDFIKIIGVLTMTVDHVGLIFFPEQEAWRIIGRLAFPIFAYLIAFGMQRTNNIKAYQKRILLFALLSQIPYMWVFEILELNILFTLLLSTFLMQAIQRRAWFVGMLYIFLAVILPFSYNVFGVLVPLVFYLWKENPWRVIVGVGLLNMLYIPVFGVLQWFSLAGVVLCLIPYSVHHRFNKWLFYWYYPVHLLILAVVSNLK